MGRISQQSGTTPEYFLGDALGSVRQMTDQAGGITFARNYDPYGVVTYTGGTSQTEYGFTGEQYGESTQLVYLRARYYNPADGRFLTKDPSGLESNLFLYAKGNPLIRTDPSGLYSSYMIYKNIPHGEFTHPKFPSMLTRDWMERERWGFFMMLREAEDGNFFQMGYPKLWGQLNPRIAYDKLHVLFSNCDTIYVDYKPLHMFYENEVKKQRQPLIWWLV